METDKMEPALAHEAALGYHAVMEHVLGLPPGTILKWITTYGLPIVLQLLPVLLGGGFSGLSAATIIAWAVAALAALKAGQPMPPLPTKPPAPPAA